MQRNTHNKTHARGKNEISDYRKINYINKLEMKLCQLQERNDENTHGNGDRWLLRGPLSNQGYASITHRDMNMYEQQKYDLY